MPHYRLSILILEIDLESMLETMSTKLPLCQRKLSQDGNLGDGNLVDKVHLSYYYSSHVNVGQQSHTFIKYNCIAQEENSNYV